VAYNSAVRSTEEHSDLTDVLDQRDRDYCIAVI
jgi:hypothetical protein